MAQYKSFFQGSDIIENAEGAVEMSQFDNPPDPGIDNKYMDMNPQVVGLHDIADAGQFQTNPDDVPGSPKGQGGPASSGSPLSPPIA